MKQKAPRSRFGCTPAITASLTFIALLVCSFFNAAVRAQTYNQAIYQFNGSNPFYYSGGVNPNINVKSFSAESVPGGNEETVMAGTIYDTVSGVGRPMFIHFDPNTNVNKYPYIAGGGTDMNILDYQDFYECRPVDVIRGPVVSGTQTYIVTSGARQSNIGANTGNPARDKINVFIVDKTGGTIYDNWDFWDNTITGLDWGLSLYPVHTIFKPNVNATKDLLYICGFVTDDPNSNTTDGGPVYPYNTGTIIVPPNYPYPGFHTAKKAFVMAIEIDPSTGTFVGVHACNYYDMQLPTGIPTNSPELDFDIAMHMTELSANYPSSLGGDIHVTGSVNALTGNGNTSVGTAVRSATMNMIIDDWTLGVNVNNAHFIADGNGDGIGTNEYGISFVENTYNVSPGVYNSDSYIIGNKYKGSTSQAGVISPDWLYYAVGQFGFNVEPDVMTITHVPWQLTATNGTPSPSQRAVADIGWAVQTMETNKTNPQFGLPGWNVSHKNFLVAGLYNYAPGGGVPNNDNIIPFLLDMSAIFSNATAIGGNMLINIGNGYTEALSNIFFDNSVGTGDPSTQKNNYLTMGQVGLQGIGWGPGFATRETVNNDIVLNSPRMEQDGATFSPNTFDFLGLKAAFVDGNSSNTSTYLKLDNSQCQFVKPSITLVHEDIVPYNDNCANASTMTLVASSATISAASSNYQTGTPGYIYHANCDNGYYKSGNTAAQPLAQKARKTVIYPNPAKDAISIVISNDIANDAELSVQLINMQGQLIGTLYKGTASNATAKMQLPKVANGLYIVQVVSNGRMVHQQKLSIQQ